MIRAALETPTPTENLHKVLAGIPDGKIGLTARKAGISETQLSRLRRGEKLDIRISTLAKIARALNVSADEILGLEKPDLKRIAVEADAACLTVAEQSPSRLHIYAAPLLP